MMIMKRNKSLKDRQDAETGEMNDEYADRL